MADKFGFSLAQAAATEARHNLNVPEWHREIIRASSGKWPANTYFGKTICACGANIAKRTRSRNLYGTQH
jgi:hypothetical protein